MNQAHSFAAEPWFGREFLDGTPLPVRGSGFTLTLVTAETLLRILPLSGRIPDEDSAAGKS